ncbi:hypothetical protein FGO68_gene1972 [Halteria grandinella]|uniref:Uncharacterized protein n=1 Tax=Halteria grandinella TaxID=5974 RepID=A0A8J8P483_HALGN|nr:hypothetical protein FGO68_gene1972 [Halteria grandinella]
MEQDIEGGSDRFDDDNSFEGPQKEKTISHVSQCCLSIVCNHCLHKVTEDSFCPACFSPISGLILIQDPCIFSSDHSKSPPSCSRCSTEESTQSCTNCKLDLCDHCSSHIHSLGAYSAHKLIKLPSLSDNAGRMYDNELAQANLSIVKEREKINIKLAEIESEKRMRMAEVAEKFKVLQSIMTRRRDYLVGIIDQEADNAKKEVLKDARKVESMRERIVRIGMLIDQKIETEELKSIKDSILSQAKLMVSAEEPRLESCRVFITSCTLNIEYFSLAESLLKSLSFITTPDQLVQQQDNSIAANSDSSIPKQSAPLVRTPIKSSQLTSSIFQNKRHSVGGPIASTAMTKQTTIPKYDHVVKQTLKLTNAANRDSSAKVNQQQNSKGGMRLDDMPQQAFVPTFNKGQVAATPSQASNKIVVKEGGGHSRKVSQLNPTSNSNLTSQQYSNQMALGRKSFIEQQNQQQPSSLIGRNIGQNRPRDHSQHRKSISGASQIKGGAEGPENPMTYAMDEAQAVLDQEPLMKRNFVLVAQTSTAIQVAWTHPSKNSIYGQKESSLQYVLQYGIGVKVNNQEQFRQIYKGKAHKCIITDLMPRTTYRFRISPILLNDSNQEATQGEWSEITNIQTKDNQTFDLANHSWGANQIAVSNMALQKKKKGTKSSMLFEKAGTLLATYGYSFGEHLWEIKLHFSTTGQANQHGSPSPNHKHSIIASSNQSDMTGIMVIGVMNKRFSSTKMIGPVINYSLTRGQLKIRILLDANKKRLIVFTPTCPQGEIFTDLPKDGLFYPAIQNKSKINSPNSLRVDYKFEIPVPQDKQSIPNLTFSSDEGEVDDFETHQGSLSVLETHENIKDSSLNLEGGDDKFNEDNIEFQSDLLQQRFQDHTEANAGDQ